MKRFMVLVLVALMGCMAYGQASPPPSFSPMSREIDTTFNTLMATYRGTLSEEEYADFAVVCLTLYQLGQAKGMTAVGLMFDETSFVLRNTLVSEVEGYYKQQLVDSYAREVWKKVLNALTVAQVTAGLGQ